MKRLNNKGFAISTLIYGLAIMGIMIVAILIATMAKTRSNNSNLVKAIEDDLNRFSKTQTTFKKLIIDGKPSPQEYIIPTDGWYRIELWGTQGGGNGGKGAYTSGIIELKEGEVLYFYVGDHQPNLASGYSTDVRLVNGAYDEFTSYETRLMSAAGGGSTPDASGGTTYKYNNKMISYGGFIYSQGNHRDFSLLSAVDTEENEQAETLKSSDNTNGTLLGYDKDYAVSNPLNITTGITPVFPVLGTNNGGDGFIPGENSYNGGSSYIAGYAGCYGVSKGVLTDNSIFVYYEHSYDDETGQNSYDTQPSGSYYFIDGIMVPGVRSGDGYAKIERIITKIDSSEKLIRKNTKLNDVNYIKDCTKDEQTKEIRYSVDGISSKAMFQEHDDVDNCSTYSIGGARDIDEIVVYHNASGVDYKKDRISVSPDGENWTFIKGKDDVSEPDLSETETLTGYRISAYQYDSLEALPSGNYIIQPVLSENKVMSAAADVKEDGDGLTIEPYVGEKRQKWAVELITDKKISPNYNPNDPSTYEYKITELARNKTLSITQDENIVNNTVSAITTFNEKARNEPQIWKIVPAGNGTYMIETVVPPITATANTGYLIPQTNQAVSDFKNQIIIGKKNQETARFKFIQLDYSSK